ncbi:MAG: hypothetical protein ACREP8_04930, partial [Candidatus Binatia bacterium]
VFGAEGGGELEHSPAILENFFLKISQHLEKNPWNLKRAVKATSYSGTEGNFFSRKVVQDPLVQSLLKIYEIQDPELREFELLRWARHTLVMDRGYGHTAQEILRRLNSSSPAAVELGQIVSGRAGFGQKFEYMSRHFLRDVINAPTVGSMIFALGVGQTAKLTALARWGFHQKNLHFLAEGVSLLAEAPAFVLSHKALHSAFITSEGQWDRVPADILSAYGAFLTFRGMGKLTRRINDRLAQNVTLKKFAEGSTSFKLAERLAEPIDRWATAAAPGQWGRRLTGRLLAAPLQWVGEKSLSRSWTIPFLQGLSTHGLTAGGLVIANGLTRALDLRPNSPMGWKADVADDVLMYGHFLASGALAHSLRATWAEPYLRQFEMERVALGLPYFPDGALLATRFQSNWQGIRSRAVGFMTQYFPRLRSHPWFSEKIYFGEIEPAPPSRISEIFPESPPSVKAGPALAYLKPKASLLFEGRPAEWVLGRGGQWEFAVFVNGMLRLLEPN